MARSFPPSTAFAGRLMLSKSASGTCYTTRFPPGASERPPSALPQVPLLIPLTRRTAGRMTALLSKRAKPTITMRLTRAFAKMGAPATCGSRSARFEAVSKWFDLIPNRAGVTEARRRLRRGPPPTRPLRWHGTKPSRPPAYIKTVAGGTCLSIGETAVAA